MPRALHVLGSLNPGGIERWLRDTVRRRDESRWRFDFCLLGADRGTYTPELEALGCRVFRCALKPRATFPARLFALLRREGYDVVHSHVHLFSGVVLAVARVAGVPARFAHSHTCLENVGSFGRRLCQHAMEGLLEHSMNAGFACSAAAAEFAGPAVRSRLRILPCGIDLEVFRRPQPDRTRIRTELGLPGDVPIVGHVGRLAPEKNQSFLLRVAARLISQVPRLRVVIVGGGAKGSLEATARRLGLQQRVVLTGPRDDVPELLGAFDVFALPSLREGLPAAILEAQAAGLPGVVSERIPSEALAVPGLVERIGLDAGIDRWAAALGRALARPRWDRGDACRRLSGRGFDVATSFRTLIEAYEEALQAVAGSPVSGERIGGWKALGRVPR